MTETMTLNKLNFAALSSDELFAVDGGVNWWGVASGVLSVAGGVLAVAAAVVSPEPVSKTYGAWSGVCWVASGITGIISAF